MVLGISDYVLGAGGAAGFYGLFKAVYYHGQLSIIKDDGYVKLDEVRNYIESDITFDALRQDVDEAEE